MTLLQVVLRAVLFCMVVFPGGKVRPGRDADSSPPSSAEVKNRAQLYLYSP